MTTENQPQDPKPKTPAPAKKTRLEIVREKAAKANALVQKLEAQARAKESGHERKLDTRRKVLLGSYLLTKIQKDVEMKARVLADLNGYLTRDAERALFDLPLLPFPAAATAGDVLQEQTAAPPAEPTPTATTATTAQGRV